jgi:vitamin K-dependent gamma-carboxylase-like protein
MPAEAWLFTPGPARRLAGLRIGLCAILAARLATGPYLELAAQPGVLFRPVWFLEPLDAMPPAGFVRTLQLVGLAAALAATVGLATRVSLPLAWLAAVPLMAMTSSLGKVVHNDVLLLLCLVPLLAAPAGAAWSLDARRRPEPAGDQVAFGWPVRTASVVVAGAYFFSGLAKLLHAGPSWALGDNLRWVLYAASDAAAGPNQLALFVADRPLLARAFAIATLGLELAVPLVLVRPVLKRVIVPSALALHAGIWATMGLNYWAMAATVLVVLVDWPRLVDRVRGRPVPDAQPGVRAPG